MVSQTSTEPQVSLSVDTKDAGTAPVAPLKPGDPIEVASQGSGPINDPSGTDTRPPGACDFDSYLA